MSKNKYIHLIFILFFSIQCTHIQKEQTSQREPDAVAELIQPTPTKVATKPVTQSADWLDSLPNEANNIYAAEILPKIQIPIDRIKELLNPATSFQLEKNLDATTVKIFNDYLNAQKNKINITTQTATKTRPIKVKDPVEDLVLSLKTAYANRIAKYVGYVMYKYPNKDPDLKISQQIKTAVASKLILRLMQSSVQFILCSDLADFQCHERTSLILPRVKFRVENPKDKLGEAVVINDALEPNLEYYFNQQIFVPEDQYDASKGVAKILENKIKNLKTDTDKDGLYMALYGMDDVQKTEKALGSMNGIYSTMIDRITAGTPIYGVFDLSGPQENAVLPMTFSYVKPVGELEKSWILSPLNNIDPKLNTNNLDQTNLDFQYNGGTQGLLRKLSENIKDDNESRGRIEWPYKDLMHNKFFIFKENNKWSVWTGTANISRTCLGTERNSNLSVMIHNDEVAKSYYDEFKQMYDFMPKSEVALNTAATFVGADQTPYFPRGRFHNAKTPNTKRYFQFTKDQTELKLYFAPTDDAEHHALIPMLLSAKSGDQILISMYGAAGIEYVRAAQLAAARGVKVKIIVDSPTACGKDSWAGRSGEATMIEKNPFATLYKNTLPIEIHKNDKNVGETWKQNHQKIGLLLRKQSGGKLNPEYFTFGSQNWSASGNDSNDENLILIRRTSGPIKVGAAFADHFENFLWPKSQNIPETGCADVADIADAIPADGK